MNTLLLIVLATFIVSLISFVGVLTLTLRKNLLDEMLMLFVALSAGALIGGAFLHLLPESLDSNTGLAMFFYVLIGFTLFFLVEKILHWRHCHQANCKIHTFAYIMLAGDFVHNFIDGLIIAASFIVAIPLGITTTLAVALHEIPQEIGDFGVLVYGGFKKSRALLLNFLVALSAILGGIIGFYLSSYISNSTSFLLPFAAGGFIYIAASDLIPEIRKEERLGKSIIIFLVFLLGIAIMYGMRYINL